MFLSFSSLAPEPLFRGVGWLSIAMEAVPVTSGNSAFTPRDPSTLLLALIGAGTIGIFLAAAWRPARRPGLSARNVAEEPTRNTVASSPDEHPQRGAA